MQSAAHAADSAGADDDCCKVEIAAAAVAASAAVDGTRQQMFCLIHSDTGPALAAFDTCGHRHPAPSSDTDHQHSTTGEHTNQNNTGTKSQPSTTRNTAPLLLGKLV